jgi:uncharacterized zinc-type alcohol dehydrogenase-like protein
MSASESIVDTFTGWAATAPGAPLQPHSYDPGPLGAEEVEVAVEYCGICHSDQSMIDNEWGNARYPFIPGHEVVGTVVRLGPQARGLKLGQRVGIGWYKGSCMHCSSCMEGSHQLCGTVKPTIVGSNGGFADRLRSHWAWAVALPDGLDPALVGPLFCAGSTVFSPLLDFDVKPTDKVGVVGIGGLGHLALGFLNAWGCEVTAFSSSADKEEEARSFGAHHFVSSTDTQAMNSKAQSLDFILSTVSAELDWNAYVNLLRPDGKLCFVGVPQAQIQVGAFGLIAGRRSICGNPTGSRHQIQEMLEFAARHGIEAKTELMPMTDINEALDRVRSNKARYRIVLKV